MIPCLFPQANDNFWKVKYDHEAAKLARAAKKNPSTSDMMRLDDSSSDEEEVILF